MRKGVLALTLGVLAACGGEEPKQPAEFSVSTQDELVLTSLPSIRQACPGLDKYAGSFQNARVEPQFRTAIVFDINERNAIPAPYKAGGHSCFIEIEKDGSAILVEKLACKSVCLDRVDVPDGQLRIALNQ
ncbi:hypothetical protein N5J43_00725 [Pseudomonas nicosulfuronedens]|uniref:hypothetical protein n=1 Tax=Pseudomonas nicosulfuronedens TaxID=2571105 RepID=UPI002448CD1B|nr:hypothetical protein [Pseudomonas nicosulfuronedens]MDH1007404.1 hypothetical protein [Pseudomonas nicosulfuronedens]MDH1977450.1 hypothetical protein [Pseudomonas nicosulfuronedens]MDH2029024.1 hypothetical protein [Pseudomonas nicosulfuronedens]